MKQISIQRGLQTRKNKVTRVGIIIGMEVRKFFYAAVFFLLLSVAATPLYSQTPSASLPNKDLSLHYTRLARQSAGADNFELSTAFTDTAIVFWQHNPDALYLRAVAMLREHKYDTAAELMATALSGTEFQYYSKNQVLLDYLDVLIRFDQAREALVILQSLPQGVRRQQSFLKLLCRAQQAEGRGEQLLKSVRSGIELYPADPFFQHNMMNLDRGYRLQAREEVLRDGEGRFYSKEAYQALITATSRPSDLTALLNLYTTRWGSDLFSRIQGYRLNDQLNRQQLELLFSGITELSGAQLEMLKNITSVFDADTELENAFKAFTGTISRDSDRDGEVEIREMYIEGVVLRVEENRDGDPGYERVVQFDNGVPTWFEIQLEDNNWMKIYYRRYPEVSLAENALGSSLIRMELVPYSVRYSLPEWTSYSAPGPVPLPELTAVPPISMLLSHAAKIKAEERNITYGFSRDEGMIETVRDSKTLIQTDILGGTVNERRRDSDGDGFYEITEYYKDGTLVRISYDGNKNGIPEYVEEYEGSPVRLWDTDEDGIIEYRMQLEQQSEKQ